jgi:hypothetical protein
LERPGVVGASGGGFAMSNEDSQLKESRDDDDLQFKELRDFSKHLTTLSTASIVILGTFADKASKDSGSKTLLVAALLFLLGTLLFAVLSMLQTIIPPGSAPEEKLKIRKTVGMQVVISTLFLVLAVASIAFFAITGYNP